MIIANQVYDVDGVYRKREVVDVIFQVCQVEPSMS